MKTLYTTTNIYLLQYCENINTEGNWITNKEDLEQKVENSLKKAYKDNVIFI